MTPKQLVDWHVIYGQNHVIEALMKDSDELLYRIDNIDDLNEVMEWWLVTPFLCDLLKEAGEVTISEYGCHWWGRQTSGQAIYMDYVIQKIAEGLV